MLRIESLGSPIFILVCLAVGAGYAFLLYSKKYPWSKNLNVFMAVMRFLTVFGITFLILSPFLKQIGFKEEKPSFVVLVDRSASMKATQNQNVFWKKDVLSLCQKIEDKNVRLDFRDLQGVLSKDSLLSGRSEDRTTNISAALQQIKETYENRKLAGVLLISDGIHNRGTDPIYVTWPFKIHTLALGDTIPVKDLAIKHIYHNKVVGKNHKFPMLIEISATGLGATRAMVVVKHNGKELARQWVLLNAQKSLTESLHEISFELQASDAGLQVYEVLIVPFSGEKRTKNNAQNAYVEVLEQKQQVLILAASPHPDIKALKGVLEKNEGTQIELCIAGMQKPQKENYDLVIFYQIPHVSGLGTEWLSKYTQQKVPLIFFLGQQTQISQWNVLKMGLQIQTQNNAFDLVQGECAPNFQGFQLSTDIPQKVHSWPPLSVPFGSYQTGPSMQVFLQQKVGNVLTDRPMVLGQVNQDRHIGIWVGEGLWTWNMYAHKENELDASFEELLGKWIQWVAQHNDQRKFRARPDQKKYELGEPVSLEHEVYNDLFEKMYGQNISIELFRNKKLYKTYPFVYVENQERYTWSDLEPGAYTFVSKTLLKGKEEKVQGAFVIEDDGVEANNLLANHELLKSLSNQTHGFFTTQSSSLLQNEGIINDLPKPTLKPQEEIIELIHLKILIALIVGLLSIEWFLRKYYGGI